MTCVHFAIFIPSVALSTKESRVLEIERNGHELDSITPERLESNLHRVINPEFFIDSWPEGTRRFRR